MNSDLSSSQNSTRHNLTHSCQHLRRRQSQSMRQLPFRTMAAVHLLLRKSPSQRETAVSQTTGAGRRNEPFSGRR